MPELRQDVTTSEWVIVAPHRRGRPHEGSVPPQRREASRSLRQELPVSDAGCPFCPGNEHMTPPEIARIPTSAEWRLRVVPNLFPAVEGEGSAERAGERGFRQMQGVGSHEVVVESPAHNARLDEMGTEDVTDVVRLWRTRYRDLSRRSHVAAVVVFKNFGAAAATSLSHAHSQIVALPVIPPDLLSRLAVATRYYDDTGRCVYDDVVAKELSARDRVVAERGIFTAFVPFAARVPFETWIAPTSHEPSFARLDDHALPDLAWLLRTVLRSLRAAAADPDFNLVIASAPALDESNPFFLWHMKIFPRLAKRGGLELGTGMYVNATPPEEAAAALRRAAVAQIEPHPRNRLGEEAPRALRT